MVLAAALLISASQWVIVDDDPGVSTYLGTEGTEIDHRLHTYKTWIRFTYHNVPDGQPNEAMTLVTFNCARNTVRTWTVIESYRNGPAEVSHPKEGPQPIPPSTYYESVKNAACYIMKSSE